jgi:hypothetical protein
MRRGVRVHREDVGLSRLPRWPPLLVAAVAAVAVNVAGCFGGSGATSGAKAGPDASTGDASDAEAEGGVGLGDGSAGDGASAGGDGGGDGATGADGGCPGGGGSGTFTCTGSLAEARIAPGGAVLSDGRVLVAGGWNATSKTLASAEIYDPTAGTFSATGAMGSEHLWAGWTAPWPVLASGKVLVAGGLAASGALLASAELYDPMAGTFAATGPLGTAVVAFDFVTLQDGSVLVAGGYSSVIVAPPTPGWQYTSGTDEVQRYVASAATFSQVGMLAEQRLFGCNVVLPSGKVLAVGGWQGTSVASEPNIEQYDPATSQWTTVGTLASGVTCSVGAFLLPSGKILLDTANLLDPVALTTAPTTNAPVTTIPIMVQLANGDVLAVGGSGATQATTADAVLYSAATGLWGSVGSLHGPRSAGRAFLMPSGDVLVVGGSDATGAALATAEIYHP